MKKRIILLEEKQILFDNSNKNCIFFKLQGFPPKTLAALEANIQSKETKNKIMGYIKIP